MGSWTFVFAALVFLAGWMIGNGSSGFDAYPFILLNLVLSCLAAMQGAILLIAARRADQISAELAAHDYAADTDSEELIGEVRALVRCIQRQVGAPDPTDDDESRSGTIMRLAKAGELGTTEAVRRGARTNSRRKTLASEDRVPPATKGSLVGDDG